MDSMDYKLRSRTLGEGFDDEYFSLRESLRIINRQLWIVALVVFTFVGAAVLFSLLQTPQYESSIKILIGQNQNAGDAYNLASDVQGLRQLALTLAEAIDNRPLAESVIEERDLRTTPEKFLEEDLSVEQLPDTQVIQVSYRDSDPERARQVANTIGEVFYKQISEVSLDAEGITVTIWELAAKPEEPISPNPVHNGLSALALGLIIGLGLAFLVERFDNHWDSPEEVEQISGVPNFGVIPEFKVSAGGDKEKRWSPSDSGERSGRSPQERTLELRRLQLQVVLSSRP